MNRGLQLTYDLNVSRRNKSFNQNKKKERTTYQDSCLHWFLTPILYTPPELHSCVISLEVFGAASREVVQERNTKSTTYSSPPPPSNIQFPRVEGTLLTEHIPREGSSIFPPNSNPLMSHHNTTGHLARHDGHDRTAAQVFRGPHRLQ